MPQKKKKVRDPIPMISAAVPKLVKWGEMLLIPKEEGGIGHLAACLRCLEHLQGELRAGEGHPFSLGIAGWVGCCRFMDELLPSSHTLPG